MKPELENSPILASRGDAPSTLRETSVMCKTNGGMWKPPKTSPAPARLSCSHKSWDPVCTLLHEEAQQWLVSSAWLQRNCHKEAFHFFAPNVGSLCLCQSSLAPPLYPAKQLAGNFKQLAILCRPESISPSFNDSLFVVHDLKQD